MRAVNFADFKGRDTLGREIVEQVLLIAAATCRLEWNCDLHDCYRDDGSVHVRYGLAATLALDGAEVNDDDGFDLLTEMVCDAVIWADET